MKRTAFIAAAVLLVIGVIAGVVVLKIQRPAPVRTAPTHQPTLEEMIAFHDAARGGDEDRLQLMAAAGTPIDVRDQEGRTPLAIAPSAITAAWLIGRGADVNARNEYGQTVLMQQSEAGNAAVVQKLVAAGAALDAVEPQWDMTALAYALHNEHMDVVAILREAGAQDDTITKHNGVAVAETDEAVRVAHAYLDAVFAGDRARLRQLSSGKLMAFDEVDFETWKAARPRPARLVSGYSNGTAATLELRGPNADHTSVTWRYDLVKSGRDWKVTAETWETRFNGVD